MRLIRMTNQLELTNGTESRNTTWWVNVDNKNTLIKSLPKLQQYVKDGSFILAEVEDNIINNGDGYTLGNENIMQKYDSNGSTGYNERWNFVSISKNDFNKVKVIHKGKFNIWLELFSIAEQYGFATGV